MITRFSIVTLILFFISTFFVIQAVSFYIRLPWLGRRRIWINLTTAPILAIAILWAAQCLGATQIRDGIVGTDDIKPYNILILFSSLAYMAITLDHTGILEAAAFWVSNKGGSNTRKLYFYFYVMLIVVSVIIGNDPVILSGTAFLVYYTKAAGLKPMAWIISEFAAANTSSMVLFVGNPTNVVICEGFRVNDAAFTAYTILPFLGCTVASFIALAIQFRKDKHLPRKIPHTGKLDVRKALRDPIGALIGSIILGACLAVIIIVSFFKVDVWKISLPFAVAKLIFDICWDFYRHKTGKLALSAADEAESTEAQIRRAMTDGAYQPDDEERPAKNDTHDIPRTGSPEPHIDETHHDQEIHPPSKGSTLASDAGKALADSLALTTGSTKIDHGSTPTPDEPLKRRQRTIQLDDQPRNSIDKRSDSTKEDPIPAPEPETKPLFPKLNAWWAAKWDAFSHRFPTLAVAIPRLPFALIPFAFSQFILIEALSRQGWIEVFSRWLMIATKGHMHATIWIVGVLGVILCNIAGTNIGATILLTKVVRGAQLSSETERAAAISLAVASNIGAVSFTFSASLAGLLWDTILRQKGIKVKQWEFAMWNMAPLAAMTSVGLAIVSAEMAVLYRN